MKTKLVFLFSLLAYLSNAQKKINTKHYNDLLIAGKYTVVLNEALLEREQPYGKDKLIDYFIAKAYCGTATIGLYQGPGLRLSRLQRRFAF